MAKLTQLILCVVLFSSIASALFAKDIVEEKMAIYKAKHKQIKEGIHNAISELVSYLDGPIEVVRSQFAAQMDSLYVGAREVDNIDICMNNGLKLHHRITQAIIAARYCISKIKVDAADTEIFESFYQFMMDFNEMTCYMDEQKTQQSIGSSSIENAPISLNRQFENEVTSIHDNVDQTFDKIMDSLDSISNRFQASVSKCYPTVTVEKIRTLGARAIRKIQNCINCLRNAVRGA